MAWPEAKRSQTGAAPPTASIYAAGLSCIFDLDKADRANALSPYLKSLPSKADLTLAMQDKFMPEAIDNLWAEIEAKGWDNTAAAWETARRDAGRDWRQITGENFGSDRAANWTPPGADKIALASSVEDLTKKVADAKAALESALSASAVDDAELTRLRGIASELDARVTAVSEAILVLEKAQTAKTEAIKVRQALPVTTVATHVMECPSCAAKLVVRDGQTLELYETIDDALLKARRLAIASADGDLSNKTAAQTNAETAVRAANAARDEAMQARDKIAASAKGGKTGSPALLATAREVLAALETILAQKKQMDAANTAYIRWQSANLKLALLVPEGLRAVTLGKVIDVFNSGVLAPLCEVASWPAIALTQELTATVGGRPRTLVSTGMQWRAQIVLQAAMASLDGSTMLVIDNLPDLDANARNGLFCILQHIKLPALICMANISEVAALDMAKHNLGGTWHIKDGKTVPFGVLAEAAE